MKLFRIKPEFVDEIPRQLDPGKLYACCRYRAGKHLCACGCGVAVNTPLHPTGWTLVCDGVSVSLIPSIGNWNEMCRSHYGICNNKIHWASKWSGNRKRKAGKARNPVLEHYFSGNTFPETFQSRPAGLLRIPLSLGDWLTGVFDRIWRRK